MNVPFLDLAAAHAELAAELDTVWKETLATSGFIGGAAAERFETNWAKVCGTANAIGVANGTDALELTLEAMEVGPGDEVIIPANTFVATAEAVVRVGATPVFADVDPDTMLVRSTDAEVVRTPQTKVLIAVHLYGQCVDFDDIIGWSEQHGVALVEDAAQAHGASARGKVAGSVGVAGCFSFYPGKNLGALGDGGAITTNDAELTTTIRTLANHGRAQGHHNHTLVGRNSRLDGLQAALLDVKLGRLDYWSQQRRAVWARYAQNLADVADIELLKIRPDADAVHHLAIAQVPERDQFRAVLEEAGIATGVHYPIPCHLQPAFAQWRRDDLPIAEAIGPRLVSLPIFPQLSLDSVDRVSEVIRGHFDA